MNLTTPIKIFLVLVFFAISLYGFLIKLPVPFRKVDKEMHTLYYFLAAAFLNFLFARRNLWGHILIFLALLGFGYAIEQAQEYSNTFLHKRIHGRFDIADIRANNKGLFLFSGLWVIINLFLLAFGRKKPAAEKGNQ